LLLALAFLAAYSWQVLDGSIGSGTQNFLTIVSWTVWGAMAIDFVIRVSIAERRPRYVLHHWYDVLLILFPMLRPFRMLRVLAFARILNRSVLDSLVGKVAVVVTGTAVMSVGLGALAVLDAEQEASNANIRSFGDALWWACTTVTTIGYGDRFPVTTQGRFVAVALMIVGIGTVGAITASVATWMISQVNKSEVKAP